MAVSVLENTFSENIRHKNTCCGGENEKTMKVRSQAAPNVRKTGFYLTCFEPLQYHQGQKRKKTRAFYSIHLNDNTSWESIIVIA